MRKNRRMRNIERGSGMREGKGGGPQMQEGGGEGEGGRVRILLLLLTISTLPPQSLQSIQSCKFTCTPLWTSLSPSIPSTGSNPTRLCIRQHPLCRTHWLPHCRRGSSSTRGSIPHPS